MHLALISLKAGLVTQDIKVASYVAMKLKELTVVAMNL